MAASEEELRLSDWKVNDDVGLCADCQSDGWQPARWGKAALPPWRRLTAGDYCGKRACMCSSW